MISVSREHGFDAAHRVYGHGGKCARLHGHGYVAEFHCRAEELDRLGMVVDFGVIKDRLCAWIDGFWDHKTILWTADPLFLELSRIDGDALASLPNNPTAENLAAYLLRHVGPHVLTGTGVELWKVRLWETRKCAAEVSL